MKESIHPFQAMVDGMGAAWQKERAKDQMTLGEFIALLETLPPEKEVIGLGELMSYRGYYCDLAFEPDDRMPVGDLLDMCRGAMGKTFMGYTGGDFMMGESTPLWVAHYGISSGDKLMGLEVKRSGIYPVIQQEEWEE
jgi:hypothetical protein